MPLDARRLLLVEESGIHQFNKSIVRAALENPGIVPAVIEGYEDRNRFEFFMPHSLTGHGRQARSYELEIQTESETPSRDCSDYPPFADAGREPNWRTSSAKRLLPQLQVRVIALRRVGY